MALMEFINFPRKKIAKLSEVPSFQPFLSLMGFGFSLSAGIWLASCISMGIVALTAAGYVPAFFIHSLFYTAGGFLGAGAYSQLLKEFQYWPMELIVESTDAEAAPTSKSTFSFFRKKETPSEAADKPTPPATPSATFSFRPREVWQDVKTLLKAYDALLLSEFNRIFREDIFFKDETEAPKIKKKTGFFKRALHNIISTKEPKEQKKKGAPLVDNEPKPDIQFLHRLCEIVHLYNFERQNNEGIFNVGANSQGVSVAARKEVLEYRKNFLPKLKEMGLSAGLAYALYHEWKEPPAKQKFTKPNSK